MKLSEQNRNTSNMPALFVGHGSPMNAIEDNPFTRKWKAIAQEIPKPKVILCISAHWLTEKTHITSEAHPKTIHDFGGFSQELFDVQYPAPGNLAFAKQMSELIQNPKIILDESWGLDHGTWSVLNQMIPKAEIPVLQLSIDISKPPQFHYDLGKALRPLRNDGVLIVGSGNMVHNLRKVSFNRLHETFGFDWALEMDEYCKINIINGNHQALIDYKNLGNSALLSVPTPEHYYPLLYILGLKEESDSVSLFNEGPIGGGITMTSVKIG